MLNERLEKLKKAISKDLRENYGDADIVSSNGNTWTGNQMADEVEQETDEALNLLHNMIMLSIDLVTRDKETLEDGEKDKK